MLAFRELEVRVAGAKEPLLRGVTLEVARGETLALVGPSGSGKSTLIRAALGLVLPSRGEVWFDGERLGPHNVRQVRHRTGYVVQDGGLFPHLTVRGNAGLLARHLGWSATRLEDRLRELCALTRLDPALLDRLPGQLSGGQRQRVGLVRALVLAPAVLLLDEPLGALDPIVRSELQDELRTIFRAVKATVVLVTHDLAEAAWFADRVAVLVEGQVAAQGGLRDILASPEDTFVGRFVRAQRALSLGAA